MGRWREAPEGLGLLRPHHRGDDVAARRALVRVALATADVIGGAPGHRGDQHAAERLADLVCRLLLEKKDPPAAHLVAAGDDRFGEDVYEAIEVLLVGETVV